MRCWIGGCVSKRPDDLLDLAQGVGDVQVRGRAIARAELGRVVGDLLQGPGQAERVARQLDRSGVGEELAAARDRELHDARRERRQDGEGRGRRA